MTPARRQIFLLACIAMLLAMAMPTAGRLLLAASGGQFGPGTGALAHHGHHAAPAPGADHHHGAEAPAADGEGVPPAQPDDGELCAYCPLLASVAVFILLWLLPPPWPVVPRLRRTGAGTHPVFRIPYGLGPCGPPALPKPA